MKKSLKNILFASLLVGIVAVPGQTQAVNWWRLVPCVSIAAITGAVSVDSAVIAATLKYPEKLASATGAYVVDRLGLAAFKNMAFALSVGRNLASWNFEAPNLDAFTDENILKEIPTTVSSKIIALHTQKAMLCGTIAALASVLAYTAYLA